MVYLAIAVVLVGITGCSGSHRAIPDVAVNLPDSGPDTSVVADDHPVIDLNDGFDTSDVVVTESVDACTPGVVTCMNGGRRSCNKAGVWMNEACPAGQVCEKGACVSNVSYVYIVVDNAAPLDLTTGLTDPKLLSSADQASCELDEACCKSADGAGPQSALTAGRIVKYWVRRLVSDLADDEHFRFVLLRPPSIESGDPRWLCDLSLPSPFPAICAGRYYQILDMDTVEQGMSSALGVDYSKGPPWWWYPAAIPTAGPVLAAARSFLTRLVAAGPGATADEVLRWVNEVETTEPTGAICSKDADCVEGFCLEGACRRHLDPEIALWPIRNYQPLPWYAYLAMGVAGTSEGDLCGADADCRIPEFRCGPDKRCHDDARHCRRRHVVLVSTFSEVEPLLEPQCKSEYDVDPSLWTHWFRWGCGCRSNGNCPVGASCIESGACDVKGPGKPDCWKFNECMPDDLQAVLDGGLPFDPYGYIVEYFHSLCSAFPSMVPQDRNGEAIRATVHTLVTHMTTDLLDVENMERAAGAAVIGGGKFVTPCRSDMLFGWGGGVETCDYEVQYQSLVQQIRKDLNDSVCEPE